MKILWGKYQEYEGPYYLGENKYVLPEKHDISDRVLYAIAATEGNFDSINMYDRCIISVGMIQWCEANYCGVTSLVSDFCIRYGRQIFDNSFKDIIDYLGYNPLKLVDKKYCFIDKNGNIMDKAEEQKLYFLGCDGKIGSWNDEAKNRANKWVQSFSTFLKDKKVIQFQIEYTKRKINDFFFNKDVKQILNSVILDSKEKKDICEAATIAYISFSANNPKFAKENFLLAHEKNKDKIFTKEWLLSILRQMTFKNKIKIYTHRYEKIIKVINSLYPINLPLKSDELQSSGQLY